MMHLATPGRRDAPVPPDDAGVSFVMPVLNEERYLRRAVASILRRPAFAAAESAVVPAGRDTTGTSGAALPPVPR